MFRYVSVKKLLMVLVAAVLALLALLVFHGPILPDGVKEAVAQAVMEQAGEDGGGVLVQVKQTLLQGSQKGDGWEVYGLFSYGRYRIEDGTKVWLDGKDKVPAKVVVREEDQGWTVVSYEEAEGELEEVFPKSLIPFVKLAQTVSRGLMGHGICLDP